MGMLTTSFVWKRGNKETPLIKSVRDLSYRNGHAATPCSDSKGWQLKILNVTCLRQNSWVDEVYITLIDNILEYMKKILTLNLFRKKRTEM